MQRCRIAFTPASVLVVLWAAGPLAMGARAQGIEEITRAGELAILTKPGIEITGSPKADVTIVEYFDYNCPYCKRVVPTFKALLTADKKLALVYKDWPVLGAPSVYAARCALAARWQGKYLVAHDALLAGPRLSGNEQIEAILRGAGVDIERLKGDLVAHSAEISALLKRNDAEAHALELDGTPGILVGRQLMPGGAELPFFEKLVANARSAPK